MCLVSVQCYFLIDMDVRRRVIIVAAVLLCGYAPSQTQSKPTNVPSDNGKQCATARNVSGLCVPRQACDYGTPAVDLTLYAPRNYTRPCEMEEVCCPPFAMVHVEPQTSPTLIDSDEDE